MCVTSKGDTNEINHSNLHLYGYKNQKISVENLINTLKNNLSQIKYKGQLFISGVIVTSKLGTSILAYEFSKLVRKPLVLHSEEKKFRLKNGNENEPKSQFDFGVLKPKMLKKALIIDDSTTGGRKVLAIIEDLRKYQYEVSDCLVVFVPMGKNVANILKEKNVNLHKIIEINTKLEG